MKRLALALLAHSAVVLAGDARVLIQGFGWESHSGKWKGNWYRHLASRADAVAQAGLDLIWLPPPSQGEGAGYHPQRWHTFANEYGTAAEHRQLLQTFRRRGVVPVADVVINHRQGVQSWAVFEDPPFPSRFICSTDEFWQQDPSKLPNPKDREILQRGDKGGRDFDGSDFPNWPHARDLDHENRDVREAVHRYLAALKAFGYGGWRYDLVKGFHPRHLIEYDTRSQPVFSVGEYWDADPAKIQRWLSESGMATAFDFPTYYHLTEALRHGRFAALRTIVEKDGLIARAPSRAVTFVENHDTGTPQKPVDSLPNDERLLQGYAYLLTHPGVPTVFWRHFDQWGRAAEIARLVKARKAARIHGSSVVAVQRTRGNDYVAFVGEGGGKPTLVVHLGYGHIPAPDPMRWREAAAGKGYRVWVSVARARSTRSR